MSTPETIYCERCGETAATVHLAHASLCDGCSEEALQEELTPIFGFKPCCTITWRNGHPAVCVVRAGTEHDHSA